MTENLQIRKLAVIGVGLIGGSLARALRQAGSCDRIAGYGRDEDHLKTAVSLGVIDEYSDDLAVVVSDADVIVLATPLGATEALLKDIMAVASADAVITDVGSEKGSVVRAARTVLGDGVGRFIPGHPIAGTEKSGVEASFAELFKDHMVILTPLSENTGEAVKLVTRMWEVCGARVTSLEVDKHDRILAATSHLPHVLAYSLVDCLVAQDEDDDIFAYSAGGFRDFTRIASSSPEMWADICVANADKLLDAIAHFREHLEQITDCIENADKSRLTEIFSRVKQTREALLDNREDLPGNKRD